MDGYLLDTSVLSAMLDPRHFNHEQAQQLISSLPIGAPKYVSVVTLGELEFGKLLAESIAQTPLPNLAAVLDEAKKFPPLGITKHTAEEYGWIKAQLAAHYLAKALRKDRPRWLENWVDKATGQMLQIDENDLWIHAQARERNLVVVTADGNQKRITDVAGTQILQPPSPAEGA